MTKLNNYQENRYRLRLVITARKRSLRRLCFHRCLSDHSGGVSAPLHAGIHHLGRHPPGQTSPRADTLPVRQPPWAGTPQADTPLGRHPLDRHSLGRHTPWADTPLDRHSLGRHHPPAQYMLGYGQQAGGTHPTGMHSC